MCFCVAVLASITFQQPNFAKIAFGARKLLTGSPKLVSLSNAPRQGAWPTARHQQPGILDVGGVTSVQILAGRRL